MRVQPLARQSSLIVKEIENETLVYDLETDKAHCLNDTAARVWKSCDGQNNVSDIVQHLSKGLKTPVDENVVWLAVDQLEKFNLLEKPVDKPARLSGMSRRQAVRALGVAAIVLPMVTSIVVPVAAQQGSGVEPGGCCVSPGDCVSGKCCQDPGCLVVPGSPSNATKKCFPVGPGDCPH